ncbi:hypothetical protein J4Q44_G00163830 [Coregonus suidteri]|uniref:Uncharacterized protein n=1 Tax=Coregonus suidteri TaxID=861788 RepID=A0AAN8M6T8_9TELE
MPTLELCSCAVGKATTDSSGLLCSQSRESRGKSAMFSELFACGRNDPDMSEVSGSIQYSADPLDAPPMSG